jgi:hypothetical protein
MRFATIDGIVKGLLLKQGKPIHWYLQYLKYACDAVRELHFDTLQRIYTERLTVTSYKSIILPCYYTDWVRVGVIANDRVKNLTQGTTINRLNNYDDAGEKVIWESTSDTQSTNTPYYNDFLLRRNSYNEFQGGIFNNLPDMASYKFKVLPERNEIQFNYDFPFDTVILEFIGDGMDGDAATQVDAYAIDTIESYIMWQLSLHNRHDSNGDTMFRKDVYDKAHRLLRARKNKMSKEDIIDSVRKGYSGTYKN